MCGGRSLGQIHFILRHENPVSHEVKEHHFKNVPLPMDSTNTRLYTLIIRPDESFSILVDQVPPTPTARWRTRAAPRLDAHACGRLVVPAAARRTQEEVKSGNLLTSLDPPIIPPKTIPDPDDKKPDDWVDEAKYARAAQLCVSWGVEAVAPTDAHCCAGRWPGRRLPPRRIPDPTATKPEDWYRAFTTTPISRPPVPHAPGAHASMRFRCSGTRTPRS